MFFELCYSLNGYGTVDIFKDIDEEDIDCIEVYARTELINLLNKKAEEIAKELDKDLMMAFYGIYGVSPQNFQFVKGDRKLICKLASRVSDKLVENEDYFKEKMLPKKRKFILNNTNESLFGLIYGSSSQRQNMLCDFRQEDAKSKLFEQAKKLFDSHEEEMQIRNCSEFTTDMVDITIDENGIKGNVLCAICRKQKTKVHCRSNQGSKSFNWVISNIKTHITNCLKSKRLGEDNNNGLQRARSSNEDESSHGTTTVSLDITPISSDADQSYLESLLENQIAVQIVQMANTVHQCRDTQMTMTCNFGVKSRKSSIQICDVPSNGDCFFSAVSHQTKYVKIDSPEHKTDTENLRKATAKHIETNLHDFKHDLKNRIIESGQRIDENNVEDQCLQFVRDHLANAGTFAGRECFDAIAAMKGVNIVVFNEMGTCYFGSKFNPSYKKAILLAFRGTGDGEKNENRNHFGSVTEVKNKVITNASQFLIPKYLQYIRNKNRNSIIDID